MKNKLKLYVFFSFYFLFSQLAFSKYTINKTYKLDLSNSAVLCMYQDNKGYMWLGTYDGLNLYNSKNTFVYRYEIDNKSSLSSNIIHKIVQADADHLWISTFLGLDKFSLAKRIVVESYSEYPEARLLDVDKEGNTWVLTKKNYISYYNAKNKSFTDIHFPGARLDSVLQLYVDQDSRVNLVMRDGHIRQAKLKVVARGESDEYMLDIQEVKFHDKDIFFVSCEKDNFYYVDTDMKLSNYLHKTKTNNYLTDLGRFSTTKDWISSITKFNDDIIVLFKSAGIFKLNSNNNWSVEKLNDKLSVFCALNDKQQDMLWLGTDGQGVKLYCQSSEMFQNRLSQDLNLKNPVRSIFTDKFNNLWLGTKGDGFVQIKNYDDQSEGVYSKFTIKNGLAHNYVFSFSASRFHNIVWIGTEGPGLSYYSYADQKVRTLSSSAIGKVHEICEMNDSILWLATAGNGLLEVNLKHGKDFLGIKSVNEFILKKGDRVCKEFHSMIFDGKSTLYVGSRGGHGVAQFNIESKEYSFIQMNKKESSAIGDILSLHYSSDSIFYVGASSGLTKMKILSPDSVDIRQYDRRSGIANDMIHGVLGDKDGFIWFSTNKGLTKYNPKNDFFHNFTSPELLISEFSDDAYFADSKSNRLFFGGVNGLVWIDPDQDIPLDSYKSDLRLFDLLISGERQSWEEYMTSEGILELPSNVNNFAISFVAIDYINGDNYEYSYTLENYTDSWTELQKNNEIGFSNLPYGDYILRVRCKSDVVSQYQDDLMLHITKLAPWYISTWAIVLYIFIVIMLCSYLIYYLYHRVIEKQALITRQIEKEARENLLEAKLDFFTNITHELCTPLTVINGITEYLEKENRQDYREYTSILKQNVKSLNELIQEILDFRKIEEAKLEANNIELVNLTDLFAEHIKSFQSIASQNKITLKTNIQSQLEWNTDIVCFNRIFLNLISNAFKYNRIDGVVEVSAYIEDEYLILKIYNTGKGIEASEVEHIFDHYHVLNNLERNNQFSSMSSQHGIGLYLCQSLTTLLKGTIEVNSKVNEFAEFIVKLPALSLTIEESGVDAVEPFTYFSVKFDDAEKPHILVVDDNQGIVWYLKEILKEEYNVICVNSGEQALDSIQNQSPALIITDIMLPNIDGIELIRRIKDNKFTKHIPLIILSAKITDREQAEGIEVGADAYLTKPFSAVLLQATVKRLLATQEDLKDYYYSPESAYQFTDGQLIHQADKDFVDEVIYLIDNNIESENLGPELIAEKLDMNTRNLYRKFKKITNLSPSDFIKDYRFNLAARLLITTDLTVLEIMYKVGITNKSYFYREFLKKYEKTPREYRLHR